MNSTTALPTRKHANGDWLFSEQMGEPGKTGFIYLVRDNYMNMFYLGKKNYRVMKGHKKGEISDWRNYQTSNKVLKELFKVRPMDEFDFIVLEEYRMPGALAYAETWTLCFVEAPTKDEWYNKRIEKVSWSVSEGITMRHKNRLKLAMEHHNFRNER